MVIKSHGMIHYYWVHFQNGIFIIENRIFILFHIFYNTDNDHIYKGVPL